jgi:hypothetical protein
MEQSNTIIIASLILNIALILERCFKRVKKSKCLSSELEFTTESPTQKQPEQVINISDIKTNL